MYLVNDISQKKISDYRLMKNFTIKELERFSGIKAHTLRTWEFRYAIIKPKRSETNLRYYSLNEVQRILNIALLNKNGYKVSRLAKMSDEGITEKILHLSDFGENYDKPVTDLLMYMYQMNSEAFEKVLDDALLNWGIDVLLKEVVYNFLVKSGLLWKGNKLSEEHFVVTIIRKKIIYGIEETENNQNAKKLILLFLVDEDQLDLALLYANYLLKSKGAKVLYMGNDVSVANLRSVLSVKKPDFLYTYLPQKNRLQIKALTTLMNDVLPNAKLVTTVYSKKIEAINETDPCEMDFNKAMNCMSE